MHRRDVASSDRLARARALVLAHGWNATSYQIINPGIILWFSAAGDAVAGYVEYAGVRVIAGAPVCTAGRLPAVVEELERSSAAAGKRVCYFGAEERLDTLVRDRATHARVLLGAQPSWEPHQWPSIVAGKASLRAQLNRARNKGVRAEPMCAAEAAANPALARVLDEWLSTRGLPPLHFLVEPETLARLFDRRVFVARAANQTIVAFLVVSPAPARAGWLVEQFVRGHAAPNGTIELLLDAAMRALAAEGAEYVTLGLAPLSRRVPSQADEPWWLRLALGWVRAHGRRFYNFEGLDQFKAKFRPDRWEPVYAIAAEPRFTPRMLYAIAGAFSDGPPLWTLTRAVWRAMRTEMGWFARRVRS